MATERVQHCSAKGNSGVRVAPASKDESEVDARTTPALIPSPGFRAAFGAREPAGFTIQPKLLVSDPGDASECEADRIAASAADPIALTSATTSGTFAQLVRPAVRAGRSRPVDADVATEILRARGGGQTLSPRVRETMERAFGTDLGAVRVHTDARADALNRSLGASAFATGQDIFFRAAAYDPQTRPGRELLAHELAHTIQQNRAPRAGPPALQRRLFVSDSGSAKPVDSADRSAFTADERRELIARKIKRALERQKDELERFDRAGEIELVLKDDRLLGWIKDVLASSIDHGSLDIADVKGLALLYFQLKLRAKPVTDKDRDSERTRKESETTASRQTAKASQDWIDYRNNVVAAVNGSAPNDIRKRVFKLALLGRGASIAFYLDTNESKLDNFSTVLIGSEQPWRKKRGKKGAANQPMLMVGPRSTQTGPFSGGLAGRQQLSDNIDRVIALHILEKNNVNAEIDSVTKRTGPQDAGHVKYYEITTSKGTFYAQNVVVGFGIGSHKKPDDWSPELERANTADTNKFNTFPRVIDLDTFQEAVADDKLLPNPKTDREEPLNKLIVVGPNAAIDALTTALRYEYPEIIWVTKSEGSPIFLPGTDNAHVKDTYEKVLGSRDPDAQGPDDMRYSETFGRAKVTVIKHDYLGVSISGDGVTVSYGNRRPRKVIGSVQGQIMVYGLGPDVEPIKKIFGDSASDPLKNRLRPVYDINRSFNYTAIEPRNLTAVVGDLNEPVAQILDNVSRVRDVKKIHDDQRAAQPLPDILPSVIGLRAKTDVPNDPTSLEFIGGTAYRLADEIKYTFVSEAIDELETADLNAIETSLETPRQSDDLLDRYAASFFAPMRTWLTQARRIAADIEKGETASLGTTNQPIDDLSTKLDAIPARSISRRLGTLAAESSSKELIAASRRLSDTLARAAAIPLQLRELANESRAVLASNQRAQPSKASEHMKAVPYSLPKNIALNDQLTPSRSEVEATSAHVPSNVARSADFISSDHRIIAVHIAEKYGHLPPLLADYVTARIVYERRHLDEASAPLPQQVPGSDPKMGEFNLDKLRAFQTGWVDKLGKLDKLFEEKKKQPT